MVHPAASFLPPKSREVTRCDASLVTKELVDCLCDYSKLLLKAVVGDVVRITHLMLMDLFDCRALIVIQLALTLVLKLSALVVFFLDRAQGCVDNSALLVFFFRLFLDGRQPSLDEEMFDVVFIKSFLNGDESYLRGWDTDSLATRRALLVLTFSSSG